MQPPQYPNQPPYYQPVPRPGRLKRFTNWYRVQILPIRIVVGIGILACALFVCSAAIAGVVQSATESNTPTPAAAVSQPTDTPTSLSSPTATPKPTATPTMLQRIQKLVSDNASDDDHNGATLSGDVIIATVQLSEALDNADYRNIIQQNCFAIEKAIWGAHLSISDANITFRAPATDKYGNPSLAVAGHCGLTKQTAAKFNWGNLTPQTAWDAYDDAGFAPALLN